MILPLQVVCRVFQRYDLLILPVRMRWRDLFYYPTEAGKPILYAGPIEDKAGYIEIIFRIKRTDLN